MKEKFLEAFRSWKPEADITVKVKFVKRGNDEPLTGPEYTVRLYDKDLITSDDYLGHAQLNDKGEAHIHFTAADMRSFDLGFEELPDLYVLLFKGDVVHFQSKVWDNVDFEKQALLDKKEGEILNFGTFLVD